MTSPPTGTVTFFFTDIEGSTRLWERNPSAMQDALVRHDEILRSAIEGHGGYVFKTVGDAFCAAFASAPDAFEAALSAQRALCTEDWNEGCTIRARMALHTGTVSERGGDYFGPPVSRVARLLSAGHGSQTLLSLATQELVRDQLPSGTSLRDLGERRLKDLFRPERIFQLIAPDLPSNLPPLKTIDERVNNLPVQSTPLVGREKEVAEVCRMLRRDEVRLLTLTGPGGTGKTRLALQASAELLERFEGGVFFVALAAITDPELVASTIAKPMGVQESADRPLTEALKYYLRGKELLLLLDNFEQVLEASPLVGELVAACPRLKVLITSRAVLHLYGEHEYAVPPLSLPDPKPLPDLGALSQYEAVRLFIERARAAKADFEVTDENAPAVAEICARLDGLPLALELAAARTKLLHPQAMLPRLGNRLKLLARGARDLPERQMTLRGTIEWSHDLLDEGEKALFARLAVFSGGRTLEAIEAVCDAEGDLPVDVLDGASSLLDKSLLRKEEDPDGEPRFVMLETVHEFAREKLEESGKAEETKRAHAEYFLALAKEAEPELWGPDQLEWLERLETEHDNLRTALSWALERGEAELAVQLGGALWWFWSMRGHLSEGRRWLEAVLTMDVRGSPRAMALAGAAMLAARQGDADRAEEACEEGFRLLERAEQEQGEARVHLCWASGLSALFMRNDHERAKELFEEGLASSRERGIEWGVAGSLMNLAIASGFRGDYGRAKELSEESLALFRKREDKYGMSHCLLNLGATALEEGDLERAATLSRESSAIFRELGARGELAIALLNLGWIGLAENLEEAEARLGEALALSREVGESDTILACLEGFGSVAAEREQATRATTLFGATVALREVLGIPQQPGQSAFLERQMAAVRTSSEEAAWEVGRAMSLEEAISYALEQGAHT